MTAILNPSGQIELPTGACEAAGLRAGEEFELMISTSGNLMLRRERPHQKMLMEHLQTLRGLEIKRRRDPIPKRVEW